MSMKHTPGPFIVRGQTNESAPEYAMGVDPATENAPGGWPYFIREDRGFATGSGPLWLAYGIQRKADADLFAAAPAMLAALRATEIALAAIIDSAPDDEPEYPDGGDTEDCENWGQEQAAWEAAERARPALSTIRDAIAAAEGRS